MGYNTVYFNKVSYDLVVIIFKHTAKIYRSAVFLENK